MIEAHFFEKRRSEMKKFMVMIMIIAATFSQVACSAAKGAGLDNEKAQEASSNQEDQDEGKDTLAVSVQNDSDTVYTVSGNNMFGLEKLTVCSDRVIAVFDKKRFDDDELELAGLKDADEAGKTIAYVGLSNLSTYKNTESYYEEDDGKYVVTAIFSYDEKNKEAPEQDVTVISLNVLDRRISLSKEQIEVYYEIYGGECIVIYSQDYDDATGKWSDVSENTVITPLECE